MRIAVVSDDLAALVVALVASRGHYPNHIAASCTHCFGPDVCFGSLVALAALISSTHKNQISKYTDYASNDNSQTSVCLSVCMCCIGCVSVHGGIRMQL